MVLFALVAVAFAKLHIVNVGDETPGQPLNVALADRKTRLVAIEVLWSSNVPTARPLFVP